MMIPVPGISTFLANLHNHYRLATNEILACLLEMRHGMLGLIVPVRTHFGRVGSHGVSAETAVNVIHAVGVDRFRGGQVPMRHPKLCLLLPGVTEEPLVASEANPGRGRARGRVLSHVPDPYRPLMLQALVRRSDHLVSHPINLLRKGLCPLLRRHLRLKRLSHCPPIPLQYLSRRSPRRIQIFLHHNNRFLHPSPPRKPHSPSTKQEILLRRKYSHLILQLYQLQSLPFRQVFPLILFIHHRRRPLPLPKVSRYC